MNPYLRQKQLFSEPREKMYERIHEITCGMFSSIIIQVELCEILSTARLFLAQNGLEHDQKSIQ